jgi:hypothetical protein
MSELLAKGFEKPVNISGTSATKHAINWIKKTGCMDEMHSTSQGVP